MENENRINPVPEEAVKAAEPAVENMTEEAAVTPEAPTTVLEKRCPVCQAVLATDQMFCHECGAAYKKVCANCKAELQDGQTFCTVCGQRISSTTNEPVNDSIAQFNAALGEGKKKKKLWPVFVGLGAGLVLGIYLCISVFFNPQHYISNANYSQAYKIAGESSKETIVEENIIAVVSAKCIDSLKDPESFELENAWVLIDDSSRGIVLTVRANNSYGAKVINYWYYTWDNDDKEYQLFDNYGNLNKETYYSWESSDSKIEKLVANLGKEKVSKIMSSGKKLPSSSIDNINELFAKDKLDDVKLIDVTPKKTN